MGSGTACNSSRPQPKSHAQDMGLLSLCSLNSSTAAPCPAIHTALPVCVQTRQACCTESVRLVGDPRCSAKRPCAAAQCSIMRTRPGPSLLGLHPRPYSAPVQPACKRHGPAHSILRPYNAALAACLSQCHRGPYCKSIGYKTLELWNKCTLKARLHCRQQSNL